MDKFKKGDKCLCSMLSAEEPDFGYELEVSIKSSDHTGLTARYFVEGEAYGKVFSEWVGGDRLSPIV